MSKNIAMTARPQVVSPEAANGCEPSKTGVRLQEIDHIITAVEKFFCGPSATMPLLGPPGGFGMSVRILLVGTLRSEYELPHRDVPKPVPARAAQHQQGAEIRIGTD
jgi:hypothetical protein